MKIPLKVKILKFVLKTINICLALSGLLALSAGFSYLYTFTMNQYEFTQFFSIKLFSAILVTSGMIALILGILGISIITESNRAFGVAFTLFVVVLQFLSMAAGIGGIIAQEKIQSVIRQELAQEFGGYSNSSLKMDWLHQEYQCCGLNSSFDWQTSAKLELWRQENNISARLFDVPDSCCLLVKATCGKRYMNAKESIYTRGCLQPYINHIKQTYLSLSKIFLLFTLIIYTLIYFLMIVIKYFKNSYTLIKRV